MKFSLIPRIYYKNKINIQKDLILDLEELHYIKNVLRLKQNDKIRVFNQYDGEFIAYIAELNNRKNLKLNIDKKIRPAIENINLTLAMSIIKPDNMNRAVSMASQLGINKIIPIKATRSQMKNIGLDRYKKIALDATRQSEGFAPPIIEDSMDSQELMSYCSGKTLFVANENETKNGIKHLKNDENATSEVILLIGPEGGFTDAEIDMINSNQNTYSISLGERILKSETAAICALFQVKSWIEDNKRT